MVEGSIPKHILQAMEQIEAQEFKLTQKEEENYKQELLRKVHWNDDKGASRATSRQRNIESPEDGSDRKRSQGKKKNDLLSVK